MIAFLLTALARFVTGASNAQWMGCEPSPQQRIYFANHSSNLDALVIWAALPEALRKNTRPVAASDYWTKGKVRMFLAHKVFRAILIERKKITVHSNPIPQILTEMQNGCSIIIFPEGKRNTGDEIGEFKSGLFHLARGCPQAELVPVRLENLNRIMPKGEFLPVPIIGGIQFGAPIKLHENEQKSEFLSRARNAVEMLKSK